MCRGLGLHGSLPGEKQETDGPMSGERHSRETRHSHDHGGGQPDHRHTHGVVDPSVLSTRRGIWAVKRSLLILSATALLQGVAVLYSGSVALLADTIHNLGDAATAIPLWVAFRLARREPTKAFTYGYGRVEDLAGLAVVLTVLFSAIASGYQSFDRLLHPQAVENLWAVVLASLIGFIGNEAVAIFRIRIGKEIGSAALVADGYHARVDGLTSLAVLFGAAGIRLGYPLADPVAGLLITVAVFRIVWESGKSIFLRMLDGVDPVVVDEILHAVHHARRVMEVNKVRVRWVGHRLHAEVDVTVESKLSVEEGHETGKEVRHRLLHHLSYLSDAVVHVDPSTASGGEHHRVAGHEHDGLAAHSHE